MEEASCGVCKESWRDVYPVVVSCGHSFCRDCYAKSKWAKCPYCNAELYGLPIPNQALAALHNCEQPWQKTVSEAADLLAQKQTLRREYYQKEAAKIVEQLKIKLADVKTKSQVKVFISDELAADVIECKVEDLYSETFTNIHLPQDVKTRVGELAARIKSVFNIRSVRFDFENTAHPISKPILLPDLIKRSGRPQVIRMPPRPKRSMWEVMCLPQQHISPHPPESESENDSDDEAPQSQQKYEWHAVMIIDLDTCHLSPENLRNCHNAF